MDDNPRQIPDPIFNPGVALLGFLSLIAIAAVIYGWKEYHEADWKRMTGEDLDEIEDDEDYDGFLDPDE